MIKYLFLTILATSSLHPFAQNFTVDQYIELHKDLAIREMKRMGVPAAITLAQGLLETENGNSELVKKSHNHFGIKCKSSWTAEGISHDDDAPGECFRSYKNAEASYRDHSNYLRGNDRYAFLFKLAPNDYRGWAYGLKKAGYATNPRYPDILIKNIEDNNLQQYTLMAIKDMPIYDASKYTSDPDDKAFEQITKNVVAEEPAADLPILVNGVKGIFAHKGRSLLAIATNNNINLAKLLEFNDLNEDGLLQKDQNIFLDKKGKVGDKDYYLVQSGENLYDVSQKNGVRLVSIYEFNALKKDPVLQQGQKIYLNNPGQIQPVQPDRNNKAMADSKLTKVPALALENRIHIVQPKEGLYAISKKYGITVLQLKEWNNLTSDNLHVGQQLIISK